MCTWMFHYPLMKCNKNSDDSKRAWTDHRKETSSTAFNVNLKKQQQTLKAHEL